MTGQRARNAIARIIGQIDPAGVRERRRRTQNDRYVGVSVAEDAMVSGVLPCRNNPPSADAVRLAEERCWL